MTEFIKVVTVHKLIPYSKTTTWGYDPFHGVYNVGKYFSYRSLYTRKYNVIKSQKNENHLLPGSVARDHTSFTDSIFFSTGACKTIVVEPTRQRIHPTTPKMCNLSSKMK